MAYTSDESGRHEVYVMRFPSGQGRWQVSSDGGIRPRWNGTGTELFFVSGNNLVVVDVSTRGVFRLGIPKTLFSASAVDVVDLSYSYDVSADGNRFVVAQQVATEEQEPPRARLVQDWVARIGERQ
jgi:hypothetical protein